MRNALCGQNANPYVEWNYTQDTDVSQIFANIRMKIIEIPFTANFYIKTFCLV